MRLTEHSSRALCSAHVICLAAMLLGPGFQMRLSAQENAAQATSVKGDAGKEPDHSSDQTSASPDPARDLQSDSVRNQNAEFGHWGIQSNKYSSWTNHSNRLIPVYTFGLNLSAIRQEGSAYSSSRRLKKLYGQVPHKTLNPTAMYFDQTDIYRLQMAAVDAGYSNIILMVMDGLDWQTTRAAALYRRGKVEYDSGRGRGLLFQDYRKSHSDFGLMVTSPWSAGAKTDVDAQIVLSSDETSSGGYDPRLGGRTPWDESPASDYLLGTNRASSHSVTDSAASATSMTTGIKTYNGAINVAPDGRQVTPIARRLQEEQDFRIGVVTSVPVSHATPAAAYANNVSRKDYQDIARDLIGLPSSAHRDEPLRGVDVLIGGGHGEGRASDKSQGRNFMPGNPYLHQDDLRKVDLENGGDYVVVQRKQGVAGREQLLQAALRAADEDFRLLGFFGVQGGHLPFQTADGKYNPTFDVRGAEKYTPGEISENPTLADMTEAALLVLEQAIDGFWLMIEAGDVDWANHANNIDNSIGAVLSGEAALKKVFYWIEENNAWSFTAVIVTADHGHFLVIDDPQRIAETGREARRLSVNRQP